MPLKDLEVKYATRRQRPYKLSDGGGLHLLVQPRGAKLWRLKYRFDGKEKLLSFGKYPVVTLAIARAKREEAQTLLANGKDPAKALAANKKPPPPRTFEPIARAWHANRVESLDPAHAARIISRMERDVFLTAGAVRMDNGDVALLAREYQPVADEDYVPNPRVGAMIGPDAMRKGLQFAYMSRSALVHLHTHGGTGRPEFSGVDLDDGKNFVPSFFNVVPHLPHALLVLSDESARGLLWMGKVQPPIYFAGFTQVGAPLLKFGGSQ